METIQILGLQGQKSLPGTILMFTGLGFALMIPLYFLACAGYNIFLNPLRSFPGPLLNRSSDLPYAISVINGSSVRRLKALHDRYGPVVRYGPNRLSFSDPAAFKDIYGHRQGRANLQKDDEFYNRPVNGIRGVVVADDEGHSRQRRYLAHAFSAKALEEQEYLIRGYVDMFIRGLKERAGQTVDMVAWFNWTTFDIIGSLAFGSDFSALENAAYHPWITTLFGSLKALTFIHASRIAAPAAFNRILQAIMIPKSVIAKRDAHFQFAVQKVEARMALSTSRKDFFSYILRANEAKEDIIPGEMHNNAATMVLAGSETTATLLSGATYYLCMNPEKMEKLTREIRAAFASEEDMNFKTVSELRYLVACLDEALRVYPPVPTGLPRIVQKGGDVIMGHYVPGGTHVSVSHWSTFHSSDNFTDPDSYIPERWLDDDDPRYASDKKDGLQPFSIGPRNCIGKNLALVEMRLILSLLLWNFDLEIIDESPDNCSSKGNDNNNNDWTRQDIYMLWEKKAMFVRVLPRKEGRI